MKLQNTGDKGEHATILSTFEGENENLLKNISTNKENLEIGLEKALGQCDNTVSDIQKQSYSFKKKALLATVISTVATSIVIPALAAAAPAANAATIAGLGGLGATANYLSRTFSQLSQDSNKTGNDLVHDARTSLEEVLKSALAGSGTDTEAFEKRKDAILNLYTRCRLFKLIYSPLSGTQSPLPDATGTTSTGNK